MEPADPLAGVDLNLFLVFEALMLERNVTRAATRLKRSQPAVSNALLRLRTRWRDPLFVRQARGIAPTPRALELEPAVIGALQRLREGLAAPGPFEPKTARHTFVVAASDHAQLLVVPELSRRLAAWPNVIVRFVPLPLEFPTVALERGELDLVLGVFDLAPGDRAPAGLKRQVLADERMVLVGRKGNKGLPTRPGEEGLAKALERAARLPQLNVSPRGGTLSTRERGRKNPNRNVVLFVPHYLVAPWVLESTDLLAVVPERVARRFAEKFSLAVVPLPASTPRLRVVQLWHPHADQRPAAQWLRGQVLTAARSRAAPE